MSKIKGGGKIGKNERRKSALKLLEARQAEFLKAGEDKPAWTTTRKNGTRTIYHSGKTFQQESERLAKEIQHLKELIK